MNKTKSIGIAFLFLIALSQVLATNGIPANITSQPTTIKSDGTYSIIFNVTDTGNLSANFTATLYGERTGETSYSAIATRSWTNNNTNGSAGTTLYTATFSGFYVNENLFTNITMKEAGNAAITNYTTSNTILVTAGSHSILSGDSFSFMGNLGSDLGNFMVNLAPGVTAIILIISLVGAIVGIIYVLSKLIEKGYGSRFGYGTGRRGRK